ncbi:MAG: hypothetical protein F4244_02555 [Gammaproteobacteria bacterium]|nr:hypothetical protein [Gammaproteobacteria bacterium]
MINTGRHGCCALALLALACFQPCLAEEQQEIPENEGQPLVEADAEETDSYTIVEYRIGGRLDRITVDRDNGLYEVYRNNDLKSNLWNADETELGDIQNVRQWRVGTW